MGFVSFNVMLIILLLTGSACKQNSGFRDQHSADTNTGDLNQSDVEKGQALLCRKSGKIWDTKKKSCVGQQEFCTSKGDGSVWQQIEGKDVCLSQRDQCLIEKGAEWKDDKCHSARELCDARNDGSQFVDGVCLTPEAVCLAQGYHYKWTDQGECRLKQFMEYCQDKDILGDTEKTIVEIKRISAVALKIQGRSSCQQAYDWLLKQTELRLLDTKDQLQLTDIYPLAEFTNITQLELTNNRIEDVFPLGKLINLKFLDLQNNKVLKNLDGLSGLENLEYLFLGYNKVNSLKPLENLKKLKYLSIFDNQINDLSPLKSLTALETLHLKSNPVRSLEDIRNLTNLNTLNIKFTPLEVGDEPLNETNCPKEGKISPAVKSFCDLAR